MPNIRIAPDELKAAVARMDGAAEALRGATTQLGVARDLAQSALGTAADHKVGTVARQWSQEFEIIADLLAAYRGVILEVAAVYSDADAALAGQLAQAASAAAQDG